MDDRRLGYLIGYATIVTVKASASTPTWTSQSPTAEERYIHHQIAFAVCDYIMLAAS